MEKSDLMRANQIGLVHGLVAVATWCTLLGCVGQEPEQQSTHLDKLAAAAKRLEELVSEAETLLKHGDRSSARAACQRALAEAKLEGASEDWYAAAASPLWKLGHAAYAAGGLQTAHDAWEVVHVHRAKSLPDDHSDLQAARLNLALTKRMLGDLQGALALQQKVVEVLSNNQPDDHPDLQRARANLANTKRMLGDLQGALALQQKVLAIRSATLPDDHSDLQAARLNLATTKYLLGDLQGALALQQKVVAVFSQTLRDDHVDLQAARENLAITRAKLGDLQGALALEEKLVSVGSATMLDDDHRLQASRTSLANTRFRLGDLQGALVLQEKVFAVWSKTLPDDHADLQAARSNLAITKCMLDDLQGALALQEKVLVVQSQKLPDDHPDLQRARENLANTKRMLGDPQGALALLQKVLAIRSATLPDDHADLQTARLNLANTRLMLGDLQGALWLQEKVLAVFSQTLPDEHHDLQTARTSLAITRTKLGNLQGALMLEEKVLAVFSQTLPDDHPDMQSARGNLALTKRMLGDLPGAAQLCRACVAGALTHLSTSIVSTRDIAPLAIAAAVPLSHIGSLLDDNAAAGDKPALSADLMAALTSESLTLLTTIRSAESHAVELLRDVVNKDPESFAEGSRVIAKASKDLEDAIALPPEGRKDASGKYVGRDDAIREAVLAKDSAERALNEKVPAELRATPTAKVLAAGLAADEAAAAFLTYTRWTSDSEKPWITTSERRFAAFVLTRSGRVTWHSLAPVADIETQIAGIRRDAESGFRLTTRSTTPITELQPGRDPDESTTQPDTLTPRLTTLRDRLLAPVLAVLPKETKRIILSPADEMLLAPIEDLPLADGRTFGETFDVRTVPSLRVLMRQPKVRAAESRAFVLGGIDYDHEPLDPADVVPDTATPILGPIGNAGPTDAGETSRSGDDPAARGFRSLPGTAAEAEQLERLLAATFPSNPPAVLRGTNASEAAFTKQAPGKSFLHVATHGYFAPESVWRAMDAQGQSALAHFDVGQKDRVGQLSPFSLTGIALAGANLPADALGRREGILTAQEIARLDLTACYLATLSACNTTLGVRRGGTGLASLRQAFHAAGARFVLATLWEVNDVEAQKLMADFYTRLWKNGEEPRAALRTAKRAARERGVPFRDWAGWWITGR